MPKFYFLLVICSILLAQVSCKQEKSPQKSKEHKEEQYNTVIVQIFDTSVKSRTVQDVTFVDEYGLSKGIQVPQSVINVGNNKRIIKVNITKPMLFTHAIFIPGGNPDNKWKVSEAGTYTVTVNQLYETISIVKQ